MPDVVFRNMLCIEDGKSVDIEFTDGGEKIINGITVHESIFVTPDDEKHINYFDPGQGNKEFDIGKNRWTSDYDFLLKSGYEITENLIVEYPL